MQTRREFALLAAGITAGIRTKGEWQKLRDRTLAGMQEVMGPLPSPPPTATEINVVDEAEFPQYTRRKITYASGDGDSVPACLFVPHDQRTRRRAALCLHQTTAIGKAEPAGLGGKPNLHYALELS